VTIKRLSYRATTKCACKIMFTFGTRLAHCGFMELVDHRSLAAASPSEAVRITRPSNEEALLIHQVLAGRKERFEDLLQPHMNVLSHIVRTQMRDHTEVEDVIQETLLKVSTRLAQFRFEASFRTWLIQIAINETRQWYRRRRHLRVSIPDEPTLAERQLIDDSPSPFDECERQETARRLHRALSRLPENYRSVVRLRDVQQLSISETARQLQLTVPAVKTRLRRGRLLMLRFVEAKAAHARSRGQQVQNGSSVSLVRLRLRRTAK
jgi:RNA polymerase sigma-70 factor (ECF subfamily)